MPNYSENLDTSEISRQDYIADKMKMYSGDIAKLHQIRESAASEMQNMKTQWNIFNQKGRYDATR